MAMASFGVARVFKRIHGIRNALEDYCKLEPENHWFVEEASFPSSINGLEYWVACPGVAQIDGGSLTSTNVMVVVGRGSPRCDEVAPVMDECSDLL